jgi:hypothetical protein
MAVPIGEHGKGGRLCLCLLYYSPTAESDFFSEQLAATDV